MTLVAALAGLAAAGRILFAAVPDVQPVTVTVAAAGVALGPRRGFAVGAIAALASNFFLGQGVHTPWQMLAWGGCGVLAGVMRPLLRDAGSRSRCSASYSASRFGWSWTSGSGLRSIPHTWAALATILGAGRCVQRCSRNGQPRARPRGGTRAAPRPRAPRETLANRGRVGVIGVWPPRWPLPLAVVPGALAASPVGPLAGAARVPRRRAAAYGGFAEAGRASDPSLTAWAALGLVAAGGSPTRAPARSPISRPRGRCGDERDGHRAAVARPRRAWRPARGAAGATARRRARKRAGQRRDLDDPCPAWCRRADTAAAPPLRARGPVALRRLVLESGGRPDSNDTAAALEALRAAGMTGAPIARGLAALRAFRNRDGGYALTPGASPTRSPRRGRSRRSSPVAGGRERRPGASSRGCGARTAATATRRDTRRRPSGSPRRSPLLLQAARTLAFLTAGVTPVRALFACVTVTTHHPVASRVVLRTPRRAARRPSQGKHAPQGAQLIDTKTSAREGAAGTFYCKGSYDALPAGRTPGGS